MNILVTGANGQLGNELRNIVGSLPQSDNHYIFSDVIQADGVDTFLLDITDEEAIRSAVESLNIEVIINCAAYTNVDAAEDNYETAYRLNAQAPELLAEQMRKSGGLLVHISTDYVYGKETYNTPCREDMVGTPTGVYGETKLAGEQKILSSGCSYIIIRTAWLYSEYGKNFVKTMLSLTATKPELKVVYDQVGTPTYALDLARAIVEIVEKKKYVGNSGIYHYSNEGVCSWYDFTKTIARLAAHTACDIQPCLSSEFPSKVHRPNYSVFDKSKIKHTFNLSIPYWVDSLRVCISNLQSKC